MAYGKLDTWCSGKTNPIQTKTKPIRKGFSHGPLPKYPTGPRTDIQQKLTEEHPVPGHLPIPARSAGNPQYAKMCCSPLPIIISQNRETLVGTGTI